MSFGGTSAINSSEWEKKNLAPSLAEIIQHDSKKFKKIAIAFQMSIMTTITILSKSHFQELLSFHTLSSFSVSQKGEISNSIWSLPGMCFAEFTFNGRQIEQTNTSCQHEVNITPIPSFFSSFLFLFY